MPRIFVSYSRIDETFARRLATSLSDMGADVWIDVEDIPAGLKWSSAIQEGLDTANVLIVLISPESMSSRNVEDEWQYYLDHNKPIIPILLRTAKIHFQLNRIQYIDFLSQDYDKALRQLHAELRRKGVQLSPPPPPRPAPPLPRSDTPQWAQKATQTNMPPQRPIDTPVSSPSSGQGASFDAGIAGGTVTRPVGMNRSMMIGGTVGVVAILAVVLLLIFSSNQGGDDDNPDALASTQTAAALLAQNATDEATAEATGEPTTEPTDAPPAEPTDTPTDLPTRTPTDAPITGTIHGIDTPITDNRDWRPIERTINGVKMVLVPRGTLNMGVSEANHQQNVQQCRAAFNADTCSTLLSDEINRQFAGQAIEMQPYWIDKYEVSNQLYHGRGNNNPVTGVNWSDGDDYCRTRDRSSRLPTEPEWEYAAKGTSSWRFPWGNDWDNSTPRANICDNECLYNGNRTGWELTSYSDGYSGVAPVDAFANGASWVGAQNMAGNVWEYTSTIYNALPYSERYENGSDRSSKRTLRGSAWQWVMFEATTSSRADHYGGGATSDFYGFRCMREYRDGDLENWPE